MRPVANWYLTSLRVYLNTSDSFQGYEEISLPAASSLSLINNYKVNCQLFRNAAANVGCQQEQYMSENSLPLMFHGSVSLYVQGNKGEDWVGRGWRFNIWLHNKGDFLYSSISTQLICYNASFLITSIAGLVKKHLVLQCPKFYA